jgi:antitoxin HicB
MRDFAFGARIESDPDGGFLVTFPDVPEAITGGDTLAEARANAVESLGLALRGILVLGGPLPLACTSGSDLELVAVAPETALKLAVVEAFRASGMSKSEFGRRLGKTENEARRILDPDHPTKLAALDTALKLLGKQVFVSIRDAA